MNKSKRRLIAIFLILGASLSVGIGLIFNLISFSGPQTNITFDAPFEGRQKEACDVFSQYLFYMSVEDSETTFEYESPYLWPSLDKELYMQLRSGNDDFYRTLSNSHVEFTQCSPQTEWGLFGRKYDEAYIINVRITPNEPESLEESEPNEAQEALWDRDFMTVAVIMDGEWKLLPSVGPEIILYDQANEAYKDYIVSIANKNYAKLYDFTPEIIASDVTRTAIEEEWNTPEGQEISDFAHMATVDTISPRIEFAPNVLGINYRWGVVFYIVLQYDEEKAAEMGDIVQLIISDWQTGTNNKVLLFMEDSWKVDSENPLF
ncbi:MAG TPA: hypothetical protein PKV16_06940 [Caldisericia bacterium]|nr:hypothetical protein [Caldisericia bacterium]HPF49503.1 hypothetical protein [Caldisericia bacterium]HPI84203.1 hypothetical protein [Caldisericia bacterium]HPQ93502.1 hypothetical protein [Caldisericia bacterium]HRV75492.1 hypothetical protein [Caldisericia bacterium]